MTYDLRAIRVGKGKWKLLELFIPPGSAKGSREKGREGGKKRQGGKEIKDKRKEKSILGEVGEMAEMTAILEYLESRTYG